MQTWSKHMKIVQLAPQSASKLLPHLSLTSSHSFTSIFSLLALLKSDLFFLVPPHWKPRCWLHLHHRMVCLYIVHTSKQAGCAMALGCALTVKCCRKFQRNSSQRLKARMKFTKLQPSGWYYLCHLLLFQTCIWGIADQRWQKQRKKMHVFLLAAGGKSNFPPERCCSCDKAELLGAPDIPSSRVKNTCSQL